MWRTSSTLIGLGIAIDYSMLVVFRYREELERHRDAHEALVATMTTAGRATMFSGAVVAVGLALLVFMPLPFMRSMGVGGLLVPALLDRRLGHVPAGAAGGDGPAGQPVACDPAPHPRAPRERYRGRLEPAGALDHAPAQSPTSSSPAG